MFKTESISFKGCAFDYCVYILPLPLIIVCYGRRSYVLGFMLKTSTPLEILSHSSSVADSRRESINCFRLPSLLFRTESPGSSTSTQNSPDSAWDMFPRQKTYFSGSLGYQQGQPLLSAYLPPPHHLEASSTLPPSKPWIWTVGQPF